MLCQNCGKNEATTHIKRVVNGDMTETHLCASCAEHLGYGDMFSGFGFNLDDFFGGLLGEDVPMLGAAEHEEKCPKCGCTFSDIAKSGKLGCADCYRKFYDQLLPSLQRIHGKIKHTGKRAMVPHVESSKELKINPVVKLKEDLQKAIEAQNFEEAAVLRDRIKEMEADNNE
jgi:protein arginine kinase activator